jgi:hypothetical protein
MEEEEHDDLILDDIDITTDDDEAGVIQFNTALNMSLAMRLELRATLE